MYKLLKDPATSNVNAALNLENGWSFSFDPANTDYTNFKSQINADEAELQDAEGNVMTPEAAKAFVKELP